MIIIDGLLRFCYNVIVDLRSLVGVVGNRFRWYGALRANKRTWFNLCFKFGLFIGRCLLFVLKAETVQSVTDCSSLVPRD